MYKIKNLKYNNPIKYNSPTDTSVNYINKKLLKNINLYFYIKNNTTDPLAEAKYLIESLKQCQFLCRYIYIDTLESINDFKLVDFKVFYNDFNKENYIFNFLSELIEDVSISDLEKLKDIYFEHNGSNNIGFNNIRYDETFTNIDGTNLITSHGNIVYIDKSITLQLYQTLSIIRRKIEKSVIYSREKGLI